MMSKEAMKLALDHSEPSILSPGWTLVRNEDIAALREALAEQPAQQDSGLTNRYTDPPPASVREDWGPGPHEYHSLPARKPEQPTQPASKEELKRLKSFLLSLPEVREARQAQQEPVATLKDEVIGCFNAAFVEGLQEALAETQDKRLKDLVERRLMYALYAAQEIEGKK